MLPACSSHGHLMLDLALGRLDGDEATEAESIRHRCAACGDWWRLRFEGERAAAVEQAVEQAFAGFAPPRRRRRADWLPLAVAAVLALAVGLVFRSLEPDATEAPGAHRESALVQELFEIDQNGDGSVDLSDLALNALDVVGPDSEPARSAAAPGGEPQPIFGEDLETGDLSSWSSHS